MWRGRRGIPVASHLYGVACHLYDETRTGGGDRIRRATRGAACGSTGRSARRRATATGLRRADESRTDGPLFVDGLIVFAAVFGWRAVRHVAGALRAPDRDDSSVRLVWGIRALIIALTSVAFALGIVYGSRATMLLAAVVLAEELYETGVVLLVLRHHRTE
jgi:hypothetical protein